MQTDHSILIIDDEPTIIDFLKYNIEKEGYTTYTALNGQEGVELALKNKPDLILMDLMMPTMDGVEACQLIRDNDQNYHPIITFLTSRSEDYSQVAGFEAGADDYITKPIRPRLLLSKIEALLRRLNYGKYTVDNEEQSDIRIDREKFIVYKADEKLVLPKKEFELLELLLAKPGKVYNRDEILNKVWGNDAIVGERTIDVHIRKLREKLGDDYIRTIKGVGYTFVNREK